MKLSTALEAAKIKILKYDPTKQRTPLTTNLSSMSIEKFIKVFKEKLGAKVVDFPDVNRAFFDTEEMESMIHAYAKKTGVLVEQNGKPEIVIPEHLKNLTLNFNLAAKGRDEDFFTTDDLETVTRITGSKYMKALSITDVEATAIARQVIPEYMPRGKRGVTEVRVNNRVEPLFNTYTPPDWTRYPKPKWEKLPDKLPIEFEKLVKHLFPLPEERQFFFAWLYNSLFKRSFTFLILCGAPGTGKNRLKLVMRALHGHVNTTDGKKSTLVERFNSQLSESTLAWFDELHYDADMENTMKELQNDSISIERKGVDATRATKIHASIVISNNKPRDNYIAFDARKFAPLVITGKRLEMSMTSDEIDRLTQKVEDPLAPTYDVAWIAQIAKWVKAHGASRKWPHLEYRGPMFWTLAHTSMTRWQKRAIMLLMENGRTPASGFNPEKKAYLWSKLQDKVQRKGDRSLQFPDFTSVRAFFEVFRDGKGKKAFSTEPVSGSIVGDFWVKPLMADLTIITEASVTEQRMKEDEKNKKESYDL